MSLSEVVVTVQDTCSVSVHVTQLTVLPDHIILGHGYDHSAGEARKAKSWKASSNLRVPEKKFSAPAADPRLSFSRITAAQTSSWLAKGIPESAIKVRQYKGAVKDPGLREAGRQVELLLTSEPWMTNPALRSSLCTSAICSRGIAWKISEPSLCIRLWLVGSLNWSSGFPSSPWLSATLP